MDYLFEFIKSISLAILAIPPTIFIFSVTLLGTAIEKSENEENLENKRNSEEAKNQIDEIDKKMKEIKKGGNISLISDNYEQLKLAKEKSDKKIKEIRKKYSRIDLANAMIIPFLCFSFSTILSYIYPIFKNNKYESYLYLLFLLISFLLLFFGLFKIYRSLILVQEISGNKKENEFFEKIKESIKLAIIENRETDKSDVEISFIDKKFPLNINILNELEIKFRVTLSKGSILNNVSVWFFIPDGFELIKPTEKESWRQSADYNLPNIRTIKIVLGNLSIGPYTSGSIKIKTPQVVGDYKIKYKVYADGYSGSADYLDLSVI